MTEHSLVTRVCLNGTIIAALLLKTRTQQCCHDAGTLCILNSCVAVAGQVGVTRIVRTSLVFLGSLDHITYNLPPCDEAPKRWQAVATILK